MTPAELRALPIVIHERRHHRHLSDPAFNDLLVIPASSCSASTRVCTVPGMVARDTQGLRSIPAIVIHVRRHHRPHSAPSMISWYLLHQAALPAHMGIQSTILDCQRLTGLRSISPARIWMKSFLALGRQPAIAAAQGGQRVGGPSRRAPSALRTTGEAAMLTAEVTCITVSCACPLPCLQARLGTPSRSAQKFSRVSANFVSCHFLQRSTSARTRVELIFTQ